MKSVFAVGLVAMLVAAGFGAVVAVAAEAYEFGFDDGGAAGWTVLNPGSGAGWELAAEAAYGAGFGWRMTPDDSYVNGEDTSLVSPLLDLSAMSNPHVAFAMRGEAEAGWDSLSVDSRAIGASNWTLLESYDGSVTAWTTRALDLSAVGAEVQLRFRFTSDGSIVRSGYQIDDIRIIPFPLGGGLISSATRHIALGQSITFDLDVPAVVGETFSLDLGDGAVIPLAAGATSYTQTYAAPGNYDVRLVAANAYAEVAQPWSITVYDTAAYGERVVVAVIDSGVNPYHASYQRPGINLPLDDLVDARTGQAARVVNLNHTGDYASAVASDEATWAGVGSAELVHFAGTNLLGIDFDPSDDAPGILDLDGHGTATSDTLLDVFPDAIVVLVQTDALLLSSSLREAAQWAVEQPWIDILSVSMGVPGNAPEPVEIYPFAKLQRRAWESGKLWVESSGNDPSPLITDGLDGSPWAISVTGSYEGGARKEPLSTFGYADVASNFTVRAADATSADGDITISGTSFSCPTVAGTLAAAVHRLRVDAGWTGGIVGGLLVPPTGVDNGHVRDAMNKTAALPEWDGYATGTDLYLGTPPVARAAEIGWGHVDGRQVDDLVAVVQSGDYALPDAPAEKGVIAPYMMATHTARLAYWLPYTTV